MLPDARGQLEAMGSQVKEAVEKVRTKEKYINAQFESLKAEYSQVTNRMGRCRSSTRRGAARRTTTPPPPPRRHRQKKQGKKERKKERKKEIPKEEASASAWWCGVAKEGSSPRRSSSRVADPRRARGGAAT